MKFPFGPSPELKIFFDTTCGEIRLIDYQHEKNINFKYLINVWISFEFIQQIGLLVTEDWIEKWLKIIKTVATESSINDKSVFLILKI
jgi:hypothetical protein